MKKLLIDKREKTRESVNHWNFQNKKKQEYSHNEGWKFQWLSLIGVAINENFKNLEKNESREVHLRLMKVKFLNL